MSHALIIVDYQNDFASPKGALYVPDGATIGTALMSEALYHRGGPVILTQDWHEFDDKSFNINGGIWPEHCVRGTWGARLTHGFDDLGDVILRKKGNSAFAGTGLDLMLYARQVHKISVMGLAFDHCVKETALEAISLGYEVRVPLNRTRAVNPASVLKVASELEAAKVFVT